MKSIRKAKFYCDPAFLNDEGIRTIVYSGTDPFVTLDARSEHYKANILAAYVQAGGEIVDLSLVLLVEAATERYWKRGQFERQEALIKFLCKNRKHPSLWNRRVSKRQAEVINYVCKAIRDRYWQYGTQFEDMDSQAMESYDGTEELVKLLYPQDFPTDPRLNRAAIDYKPLYLPDARGKKVTEHPTSLFPKELFESIKTYCTGFGITHAFRLKAQIEDTKVTLPWTMNGDLGKSLREVRMRDEDEESNDPDDEEVSAAPFDGFEDDDHEDMEIAEIELREDLLDDLPGLVKRMNGMLDRRDAERREDNDDTEEESDDEEGDAMADEK
jgi:hypothetical protein